MPYIEHLGRAKVMPKKVDLVRSCSRYPSCGENGFGIDPKDALIPIGSMYGKFT